MIFHHTSSYYYIAVIYTTIFSDPSERYMKTNCCTFMCHSKMTSLIYAMPNLHDFFSFKKKCSPSRFLFVSLVDCNPYSLLSCVYKFFLTVWGSPGTKGYPVVDLWMNQMAQIWRQFFLPFHLQLHLVETGVANLLS